MRTEKRSKKKKIEQHQFCFMNTTSKTQEIVVIRNDQIIHETPKKNKEKKRRTKAKTIVEKQNKENRQIMIQNKGTKQP